MAGDTDSDQSHSVAGLSARFDRLEKVVKSFIGDKPALGHSAASVACDNDNAGRRQVVNEPVPLAPGAAGDSYSELQSEFRAIKESVAKIKLPSDLVVGGRQPFRYQQS